MALKIKRVYDQPATTDGTRVLVDRLWPRGVSKEEVRIAEWGKDLAPSNELRKWFHQDPENRFKLFQQKYRAELRKNKSVIADHLQGYGKKVTLITSVKDIEHSHIPTLKSFLETLRKE